MDLVMGMTGSREAKDFCVPPPPHLLHVGLPFLWQTDFLQMVGNVVTASVCCVCFQLYPSGCWVFPTGSIWTNPREGLWLAFLDNNIIPERSRAWDILIV